MRKTTFAKRFCVLLLTFTIILVSNLAVTANGVVLTNILCEARIMQMATPIEDSIINTAKNLIINSFLPRPAQYDLGNAFTIYNADIDCIIYNLPVFSCGECVAVIEYSDDAGMSISDSIQIYESIIGLPKGEYVLYITGGIIYAQSENDIIVLDETGFDISSNEQYLTKTFAEKKNEFTNRLGITCCMTNISSIRNIACSSSCENSVIAAEPDIALPDMSYVECDIEDFVLQGNKNLCWAACVATIVNFKKSLYLTAEDVADKMGIAYMQGAGADEIKAALASYGLNYSLYYSQLGWSTVKSKINRETPFVMVIDADVNLAHAILAYGYSYRRDDSEMYANGRYITAWDPRDVHVSWKYSSTTVFIKGYNFTWDGAIA